MKASHVYLILVIAICGVVTAIFYLAYEKLSGLYTYIKAKVSNVWKYIERYLNYFGADISIDEEKSSNAERVESSNKGQLHPDMILELARSMPLPMSKEAVIKLREDPYYKPVIIKYVELHPELPFLKEWLNS